MRPGSYQEINNFYTVTVYNKGAEVVRMLHTLLGAEGSGAGRTCTSRRHDGQAVTTTISCRPWRMLTNGIDLSQFKPLVRPGRHAGAVIEHAPTTRTPASYEIQASSSPVPRRRGRGRKLPVSSAAEGGAASEESGEMRRSPGPRRLDAEVGAVRSPGSAKRSRFEAMSLVPAGVVGAARVFPRRSAIEYGYSPDELYFLVVNDNDPFARWEACAETGPRSSCSRACAFGSRMDRTVRA